MKTVFILAGLVALTLAGKVPFEETKTVDAEFLDRQKKILSLFVSVDQVFEEVGYYDVGKNYDFEANLDKYTNKEAVEEFWRMYKNGLLPKSQLFSIVYEKMSEEAISLFYVFYYAKDFDTFYKSAAWAKVHVNGGQFLYAYYTALLQREDTYGFALPAPFEVFPQYFVNYDTFYKIYRTKMQQGFIQPEVAAKYGMVQEGESYVFYSNYSNAMTYSHKEERMSYFYEDIGLNSYYYFYQCYAPFWFDGKHFEILKERRGEIYYYFYQQLLARYYAERLTNDLGEIPKLSWYYPVKTGFSPALFNNYYPFVQRSDYYKLQTEDNGKMLQYLDFYEKNFLGFLEKGKFKAYGQEIDFQNSKAINFVGNYWQSNVDLYEKSEPRNFWRSYEMFARRLLSGAPKQWDEYTFMPSALDFYQTTLRDPVYYQFVNRVVDYFLQYKEYLEPYTQEFLHWVGVKINDVKVEKLVTFFDFYDFEVDNGLYWSKQELSHMLNSSSSVSYKVRQPRLNYKPFTVTIDVKSDLNSDAVFKVFFGPKYDSNGLPISMEDNWMNFYELDWFIHKLTPGINKIERSSEEFFFYRKDFVGLTKVLADLEAGKVPTVMTKDFDSFPKRLLLPRGTEDGFPFQIFVVTYPYQALGKEYEMYKDHILDARPMGYPLDRPVSLPTFKQPNMFFKDVFVYHQGEYFPYKYNVYPFKAYHNEVPK